jgi:glycosyltransferase involved in cell wall biosynthesis
MRDFSRDGGGSIRMYGILNAIAVKGHEVIFISNASQKNNFHSSIKHIPIGYKVNHRQKSILQMLIAFLPASLIYLINKSLFDKLSKIIKENTKKGEKIYFFEYLDNSLAYVLKKKKIIKEYINDVHGIATIEFAIQRKTSNNIKTKILYSLKYLFVKLLDSKIFNYGYGFIYASNMMKHYYENTVLHTKKKAYIIPNALSSTKSLLNIEDLDLKNNLLNQFDLQLDSFVFLFVGGYKPTAGVDDLIKAFKQLHIDYSNTKLVLIGKENDTRKECRQVAMGFEQNIFFIDNIPYEKLYTYQCIAHVIVCPDRMNPYSNMIVHLKYFDALASGKLVINGAFESVMEINKDNFLSLTFEPSNVDSLYNTMKECIDNYDKLTTQYKDTAKYALENLTYDTYIDTLYN